MRTSVRRMVQSSAVVAPSLFHRLAQNRRTTHREAMMGSEIATPSRDVLTNEAFMFAPALEGGPSPAMMYRYSVAAQRDRCGGACLHSGAQRNERTPYSYLGRKGAPSLSRHPGRRDTGAKLTPAARWWKQCAGPCRCRMPWSLHVR